MGLSREEFEARRAARQKGTDPESRAAQEELDLEAIDAIAIEKGVDIDIALSVRNMVAGQPVILGVRRPSRSEHKRFVQTVTRASGNADAKMSAIDQLGEVCWVYPTDKASRDALVEANPGLIGSVGNRAYKLVELESEAEKKD